jgi:UDP-N-acetylglucosamine--N-acetylmuramyl-(pentapeptide) pyrophosphoryl-undecaprenol N-acetylglucosamine transferase
LLARFPDLSIVHQTGSREFLDLCAFYQKKQINVQARSYMDDMPQCFADADLIVCRSGASTVAEIAAAGKCALFVPFPGAADDHQLRNAELLVQANAALLMMESELTAERFVTEVAALLSDPRRLAEMGIKARTLAHPDAAAHIAEMALSLAGKSL